MNRREFFKTVGVATLSAWVAPIATKSVAKPSIVTVLDAWLVKNPKNSEAFYGINRSTGSVRLAVSHIDRTNKIISYRRVEA
jgi:hypothetical protein